MAKRTDHKEKALVKMLTYVLGINPAEFGLLPDEQGWVDSKELINALHEQDGWRHARLSMLSDVAVRIAPGEFELAEKKVRCLARRPGRPQVNVDPPGHIYVGVRRRGWPVIKDRGLSAGARGPVMLAKDKERALVLGRRLDAEPILITVQAGLAQDMGAVFSGWGDELYISDWIPADCLMGPAVVPRPVAKKAAKEKPEPGPKGKMPSPDAMPGSFLVTPEDVEKPYKQKGLRKRVKWKDDRRRDSRK